MHSASSFTLKMSSLLYLFSVFGRCHAVIFSKNASEISSIEIAEFFRNRSDWQAGICKKADGLSHF